MHKQKIYGASGSGDRLNFFCTPPLQVGFRSFSVEIGSRVGGEDGNLMDGNTKTDLTHHGAAGASLELRQLAFALKQELPQALPLLQILQQLCSPAGCAPSASPIVNETAQHSEWPRSLPALASPRLSAKAIRLNLVPNARLC